VASPPRVGARGAALDVSVPRHGRIGAAAAAGDIARGPYAVAVAKKKTRAPAPPRTVQAPRRRDTKAASHPLAEVPRWVWFASIGVLAGAAVAIAAVVGLSGNSVGVRATMLAAGCTYRDVPPKPPRVDPTNYHADFPKLTTSTKNAWSTSPPSGGGHYSIWAVWGFYSSPVNPRQVVHNEEHGAVVLWWGPQVPASTVARLKAFYNQSPDGMFGTPYPGLGDKIALTAWTGNPARYYVNHDYGMGHIAVCSQFDQKAFAAFRSAYRGQGPEGIPLSADEPGCGPSTNC
jgi:Protein of unknown function (DUF3105)